METVSKSSVLTDVDDAETGLVIPGMKGVQGVQGVTGVQEVLNRDDLGQGRDVLGCNAVQRPAP